MCKPKRIAEVEGCQPTHVSSAVSSPGGSGVGDLSTILRCWNFSLSWNVKGCWRSNPALAKWDPGGLEHCFFSIWRCVRNLLLSILMGWTSIYQLFWGSLGVQGFNTLPYIGNVILPTDFHSIIVQRVIRWFNHVPPTSHNCFNQWLTTIHQLLITSNYAL